MSYKITMFPFPSFSGKSDPNRHLVTVENTDGKICKFAVFVSPDGIEYSCRTPTPGFPAPNEMTEDEVKSEMADMQDAIKTQLGR